MKPESQRPLYIDLKRTLQQKIARGQYPVGAKLPSEQELMNTYRVSRATVRKTLELLESEGLISREQGRGTFVKSPLVVRRLPGAKSYAEEVKASGWEPSARLIDLRHELPSASVATRLDVPKDDQVVKLTRQVFANGQPLGLHMVYYPARIWKTMALTEAELNIPMLWERLREKGIILANVHESIEARKATAYEAVMLDVEEGDPVLYVERTAYTAEGVGIEFGINVYRSQNYKYEIGHPAHM